MSAHDSPPSLSRRMSVAYLFELTYGVSSLAGIATLAGRRRAKQYRHAIEKLVWPRGYRCLGYHPARSGGRLRLSKARRWLDGINV